METEWKFKFKELKKGKMENFQILNNSFVSKMNASAYQVMKASRDMLIGDVTVFFQKVNI